MATDEKRALALLKELNDANGVSGNEGEVAALMEKHLAPITDERYTDLLGNAVFIKKGKNPDLKIMLAAHMDEIGFMVLDATKNGYVTVVPVGFHDPNILVNQYLTILTDDGPVYGVIGAGKPVHQTHGDAPKPFAFKDIAVDVGAKTGEEVAAMGIRPGDFAVIEKESRMIGENLFCGKAVDNRSGCAALILAMEELSKVTTDATVYACGTVQEEVGLKGADVLVRGIDPQYALCLDVGFATLDGKPDEKTSRMYLGDGPGIELYDWSPADCTGNIVPKNVVRALEDAAKGIGLKHQYSLMLDGGTDAAVMTYANNGVLTGGLSIPQRYMHTTVGVIDIRDMIGAGSLTAAYVKGIVA
ncbi:MAG: M20/M25/M40 family metallo-hydrolase [Clostridiales Family XIII bacterium]|jgi:endoglucanase|nr:M20/M25/M40 family metallo-hydrolase [Clostridiales Family XIII bacterium]